MPAPCSRPSRRTAGRASRPEAQAARATYEAVAPDLPAALHACAGGQELAAIGFGADVDVAAEVGVSAVVPVLRDGVFVDAVLG